MKKSNKILVILIILIVLLLIAGGAFAYIYVATDLLRTDEEMFYKYLGQLTAEENGFIDKNIEEYQNKKKETPYENSGDITVKLEVPEELEKSLESLQSDFKIPVSNVNDLSINFSGKSDVANRKVEKEIVIDYGKNVTFPVTYKQVEDMYAVKIQPIKNSKFIAVKNENLKELAQNLGLGNMVDIPDKIELSEIEKNIEFTEEEKTQLKEIYGTVLNEQLTEECFSRVEGETGESYVLQLSGEQLKNLIIKMLETTKQNTLLIDKINAYMAQIDENMTLTAQNIDKIINDISREDVSELPDLKITLTQNNKLLNQIVIEYANSKLDITKVKEMDKLAYNIDWTMKNQDSSTETDSDSSLTGFATNFMESLQGNFNLNVQYTGLQGLNNVQEKYQIGFGVSGEGMNLGYEYNINNSVQFKDSVSIEDLTDNKTVVLNKYNEEVLTKFVSQMGEMIVKINKEQMEELGLKEIENPLLYSNPIGIISLGLVVYNMAADSIGEVNFAAQEILAFNDQFEQYRGENIRGSEVNALLKSALQANRKSEMEGLEPENGEKFVDVYIGTELVVDKTNATTSTTKANTATLYSVELEKDKITGFVNKIVVTEK